MMTKLEQLIEQLCPDGVPFSRVEEICSITRGRVISKDYINENVGEYPVYSSQTENNGELGRISTYDLEGDYLTWTTDGANAGTVFYRSGKFSITNVCGLLKVNVNSVVPKYLYYYLNQNAPNYVNKGMGNPKLMSNVMARIKVPVPPLEVQAEIVRILDTFTELTTKLATELTNRKKQYEYYRDALLSINTDNKKYKLSELFNTRNGYTPSKNNYSFWSGKTCIPWFRMEDIRENGRLLDDSTQHVTPEAVKGDLFPAHSIIISTSATIGEHALITVPSLANQRFTYLMLKPEHKGKIDIRYIFYYCYILAEYCRNNLNQGNFASVDMTKFNQFVFSIPSIDKQRYIVAILDRFDKLCNDISEGLPAEIEARQKQYEYYRDKLLSFREMKID